MKRHAYLLKCVERRHSNKTKSKMCDAGIVRFTVTIICQKMNKYHQKHMIKTHITIWCEKKKTAASISGTTFFKFPHLGKDTNKQKTLAEVSIQLCRRADPWSFRGVVAVNLDLKRCPKSQHF